MNRRAVVWVGQGILAVIVGVFVWRTLAAHWTEFRAVDVTLTLGWRWLAACALLVLATYGLLIEAWRRVLAGWGEHLAYRDAVRVWTVSNLGRYLPGKVWGVAGMALLAERAGVSGWAAAGSALIMQAVALGTGVAVVAGAAPGAASPVWLVVGGAVATGTVAGLAWPRAMAALARVTGRAGLRPLSVPAVLASAAITVVSWLGYGVAFWCLARGLLGPAAAGLALPAAIGVFAGGYIVGLIALFAPGGIGVREVVFLGLLTPALGAGGALAVTIGSRVLLTLTEAGAAVLGLLTRTSRSDTEQ